MFFQDSVRNFASYKQRRANNCLLRERNAEVLVVMAEVVTLLFYYSLTGLFHSNLQWRR